MVRVVPRYGSRRAQGIPLVLPGLEKMRATRRGTREFEPDGCHRVKSYFTDLLAHPP
jgi:hypothetical protein